MAEDNTGSDANAPRTVVVTVDNSELSEKAFDCEYIKGLRIKYSYFVDEMRQILTGKSGFLEVWAGGCV